MRSTFHSPEINSILPIVRECALHDEKTFRDELARHPHSGRALFGLWQSLKAQGKKTDAKQAEAEFRTAWKNADVKLTMEDL